MTKDEFNQLIGQIRHGDDDAMDALIAEMDPFIGGRIKSILQSRGIDSIDYYYREDLMQAGRLAVLRALKTYEIGNTAKFSTYAKIDIDHEINRELSAMKTTVKTRDPILAYSRSESEISPEEKKAHTALAVLRLGAQEKGKALTADERKDLLARINISTDNARFNNVSLVLQIMEILKSATDEHHSITIEELKDCLTMLRIVKYDNAYLESPNTIPSTINNILTELDPMEYTGDNDGDYKIKYRGYDNDELKKKLGKAKGKHEITDFRYIQPFSYRELDELIQAVSFSIYLSAEEKDNLIKKIFDACGGYYNSPFWDGKHLRFNPSAIHGRFSRSSGDVENILTANLKTIQTAINNMWQIKFTFNGYNSDGNLVPTPKNPHYFSPFHLVVYQDLFYLIGLWSDGTDKKIYHYRVDLMSDVEILKNNEDKPVRIKMYGIEDLPIWNFNWDPEKYLSEHIYMAYDEPRDIKIKIHKTGYTDICKWFSSYTKTNLPCEEGYDIIIVKTSPSMIVHWALQYSSKVEIMDEDIRLEIRKEIKKLGEKYGKTL
ncbi:MAG: WYL domain-containing protein [Saccharofermentans sp.]|nr:WYL domain-containing protein [Saccharofermentans sp.]